MTDLRTTLKLALVMILVMGSFQAWALERNFSQFVAFTVQEKGKERGIIAPGGANMDFYFGPRYSLLFTRYYTLEFTGAIGIPHLLAGNDTQVYPFFLSVDNLFSYSFDRLLWGVTMSPFVSVGAGAYQEFIVMGGGAYTDDDPSRKDLSVGGGWTWVSAGTINAGFGVILGFGLKVGANFLIFNPFRRYKSFRVMLDLDFDLI